MMKMMRRKGEQDCHGKRGEKKRKILNDATRANNISVGKKR